jgi:hypothetical protein
MAVDADSSYTDNIVVNQLFGTERGLGMGLLTFDWSQAAWVGSPLMIPWWAEVHMFLGFVIFWWIVQPALYYTNVRTRYPRAQVEQTPSLSPPP